MDIQTIIESTKELISFPSTENNQEARKKVIDFVKKQLEGEGLYIKEFEKKGVPSLVVTLNGEKNPFLFLNGHLDVVPAEKSEFIPKIKDKRIYGRGSGDMKAAVAVMIEVLRYFSRKKEKPSLGLMIPTDEEVGGVNGTGHLLHDEGYSSDLAIIPDGGGDLAKVVTDEKGVIRTRVESRGTAAHGAYPWKGKNAIDELINLYKEIRKEIPQINEKKWANTLNLGKIYGGEAVNKVADFAESYLDIRVISEAEKNRILERIKQISKKKDFSSSKIEFNLISYIFSQDTSNELVKKYINLVENKLNKKMEFKQSAGASDARHFSAKNIPAIVTQIKQENIHSAGEWVDIQEIEKFYKILVEFIESLDKSK